MGHTFSAILGGILFAAFVFGLALSIDAIPFYLIVVFVIGLLGFEMLQDLKSMLKSREWRSRQNKK